LEPEQKEDFQGQKLACPEHQNQWEEKLQPGIRDAEGGQAQEHRQFLCALLHDHFRERKLACPEHQNRQEERLQPEILEVQAHHSLSLAYLKLALLRSRVR
jgi:hypothetical protein